MECTVHTKQRDYRIVMKRGILKEVHKYVKAGQRVCLISEKGIPECWRHCLEEQFPEAVVLLFEGGEKSKNLETWKSLLEGMLENKLTRSDLVIALGGGVTGDMAGFAAASYMRGIEYINIPTTTLSDIDSSIGGKTAVDLNGVKNCVGAFWQPSLVLIDPDVLSTLPLRHYRNGLSEAVKEGLIKDAELFALFENENVEEKIEEIIWRCLLIKKEIVEKDERESGERKLLNFGHTFGHAFESSHGLDMYLHGECVAMGMMKVLKNEEIRERLRKVLEKLELPVSCQYDPEELYDLIRNDKKAGHNGVTMVQVDEIGKGYTEQWTYEQIKEVLEQ